MGNSWYKKLVIFIFTLVASSNSDTSLTDIIYEPENLLIRLGSPVGDIVQYLPEVEKLPGMVVNNSKSYSYDFSELGLTIITTGYLNRLDEDEHVRAIFFDKPIIYVLGGLTIGNTLIDILDLVDQMENENIKFNRGIFTDMFALYIEVPYKNRTAEITYEFYLDENNFIIEIFCETSDWSDGPVN
jgi:hypothetical protein